MTLTSSGESDIPALDPAEFEARRRHFMSVIDQPQATTAAQRLTSPRRVAAGVMAFAALVTAGVVGLQVLESDPALGAAAFAVTPQPTGTVAVRIVSTEATAAQMTHQLHAAGLSNVTITTVPASPSLVGTWISEGGDGAAALEHQVDGYTATVQIPASLRGPVTLTVGRAPEPGETINALGFRNQAAPGGPLGCRQLQGASVADAAAKITALGYTIDYWYSPDRHHPLASQPAPDSDVRVVGVYNDDIDIRGRWRLIPGREHTVTVQVAPVGSPLFNDGPNAAVWAGFPPSLAHGDPATAGC